MCPPQIEPSDVVPAAPPIDESIPAPAPRPPELPREPLPSQPDVPTPPTIPSDDEVKPDENQGARRTRPASTAPGRPVALSVPRPEKAIVLRRPRMELHQPPADVASTGLRPAVRPGDESIPAPAPRPPELSREPLSIQPTDPPPAQAIPSDGVRPDENQGAQRTRAANTTFIRQVTLNVPRPEKTPWKTPEKTMVPRRPMSELHQLFESTSAGGVTPAAPPGDKSIRAPAPRPPELPRESMPAPPSKVPPPPSGIRREGDLKLDENQGVLQLRPATTPSGHQLTLSVPRPEKSTVRRRPTSELRQPPAGVDSKGLLKLSFPSQDQPAH